MISKKYNEILTKLEKNIVNEKDLNLVKSALSELVVCYSDEITKLADNYHFRIASYESRLSEMEKRYLESKGFKQDSFVEEISCPYCGVEFSIDYYDSKTEITCPKCNNLIELDWGDFDDDM